MCFSLYSPYWEHLFWLLVLLNVRVYCKDHFCLFTLLTVTHKHVASHFVLHGIVAFQNCLFLVCNIFPLSFCCGSEVLSDQELLGFTWVEWRQWIVLVRFSILIPKTSHPNSKSQELFSPNCKLSYSVLLQDRPSFDYICLAPFRLGVFLLPVTARWKCSSN